MLSKQDRAMIRESARGMNGADAVNFEGAVIARLQELLTAASFTRLRATTFARRAALNWRKASDGQFAAPDEEVGSACYIQERTFANLAASLPWGHKQSLPI